MREVLFYDKENDVRHGGILTDEGDIICGCCGCLIPGDEIGEEYDHQILKIFDHWVNLDEEICGDMLHSDEDIKELSLAACPACKGKIQIYTNIERGAFAKCGKCKSEFHICGLDKIPLYNGHKFRKQTADKIRRMWNLIAAEVY